MTALAAPLRDALLANSVVVASSALLSRQIRRDFARHQAERNIHAWERRRILPWEEWLRELGEAVLWSGYTSPRGRRHLLTPLQEQLLWERVIEGSGSPAPLNVRATAALARDAWSVLQAFRLPDPAADGFSSAEHAAFSEWMKDFHERCADHRWLDRARFIDSLVPAVNAGALPAPPRVALIGFHAFTPQQRSLLRALAAMGTHFEMIRPSGARGDAALLRAADRDSELAMAVHWCAQSGLAGAGRRVGLIVPDLGAAVQQVEHAVRAARSGGPGSAIAAGTGPGFDIGAGRPLRKQPVVVAADHVLALAMGSVSMRVLSRIVRSPFIGGGVGEATRRAGFDVWMRSTGAVDVETAHLRGMLEAYSEQIGLAAEDFDLHARAAALEEWRDDAKPRRPAQWASRFAALLELFGWPGDASLTPVQHQARAAFAALVDEFATLDTVLGRLNAAAALRIFRHLLRERQFRLQVRDAPVAVLAPADAEWLQFDYLWICGAADASWASAVGRPNPFVPRQWQREHNLPAASAAARSARAGQRADRLLQAAPRIVVSQPGDPGRVALRPFGALRQVTADAAGLGDVGFPARTRPAAAELETVRDADGPPLEPGESVGLDQQVLALQAACPFRSFATRRLGAVAPRALRPGLRPEARVALVRMTLEHLWHRIESFEVLQAALDGEHLEVQVWEVADTVLAVFERKLPVRLSRRYRALEHSRLTRLILQWLRVEAARAPFTVARSDVFATLETAGLSFRAHVDRLDRVGEQGVVAIDYDIEPYRPERWIGARPDSPALIAYALASDERPVAFLTGCVSADHAELSGVQHRAVVPGMPTYAASDLARLTGLGWDELRAAWRETVQRLAEEFGRGDARVAPKHGAATCRTCDLAALCRVDGRVVA